MEELRKKWDDLVLFKGTLKSQLSDMVRQQQTCQDKIFSLLTKNSRLVTECDSLSVTVKTRNGELVKVKKNMA